MGLAKKLFKFTAGSATGAAVGVAVASALAPQRGDVLRKDVNDLVAEARTAGANAQTQTERELAERFRRQVNDPDALTNPEFQRS